VGAGWLVFGFTYIRSRGAIETLGGVYNLVEVFVFSLYIPCFLAHINNGWWNTVEGKHNIVNL
jgi:hypothetical protein